MLAGTTHVQEEDGALVLSVWRYGSSGEQVKTEYSLPLVVDEDRRIRIVQHLAVEMARRCGAANEEEETKVGKHDSLFSFFV